MRFADLLRVTVLGSAATATLLATLTLLATSQDGVPLVATVCVAWWLVAIAAGLWTGRGRAASPAIGRLLASARHQTTLPELKPASTLLNRLWALIVSTLIAAVFAFLVPQVPGIAAGFAMLWALAWRRQHAAVTAIEERDGVRFYVDDTSPLAPIRLVRTPGLRGG